MCLCCECAFLSFYHHFIRTVALWLLNKQTSWNNKTRLHHLDTAAVFKDCYQIHISIFSSSSIYSEYYDQFPSNDSTTLDNLLHFFPIKKALLINWLGLNQSKQKRTTLSKRWMKSGNGWRELVTNGWTECGIGVQDTELPTGTLYELKYEDAEPQGMTALSGFMITGNYQTNLTCVEHWLPLFAAK